MSGNGCDDKWDEGFEVGYGEGYAAGKNKAHFEVRKTADHASGCGCEPCKTRRVIVQWVKDKVLSGRVGE